MADHLGQETELILFLIKTKFKNILNNSVTTHCDNNHKLYLKEFVSKCPSF